MTLNIRKAERRKAKLRLALIGLTGTGKTYSAIEIARGVACPTGKILLVDTENGSGELYSHLSDYDYATIEAPFETEKYIEAIHEAEAAGYDVIILDSLSHAWSGAGGLLEQQDAIASRPGMNKFTSWSQITPKYQKFIDTIVGSKIHIIGTMRSKAQWIMTPDSAGKTKPEKGSLTPVQREGIDYEFTVVLEMDKNHYAEASKDRTGLFDGKIFIPDVSTGEQLRTWLDSGVVEKTPAMTLKPAPKAEPAPAKQVEAVRPKHVYTAMEIDAVKTNQYIPNGWSTAIFDKTATEGGAYFDGIVWDRSVVDADFRRRYEALHPVKQEKPEPKPEPKPTPEPAPLKTEVPKEPEHKCPICGKPSMNAKDAKAWELQCKTMDAECDPELCKDCAKKIWEDYHKHVQKEEEHKLAPFCMDCGNRRVLPKEEQMSRNLFGVPLCPECYKKRLMAHEAAKKKEEPKPEPPKQKSKYKCSCCGEPMTFAEHAQMLMFNNPPICQKCMDKIEEETK